MQIDANFSITSGKYWDATTELHPDALLPEPNISTLRRVIEESISAHMVADVPVMSFLSGGLDSSIITALAAKHNSDIESYTIAFRAQDKAMESTEM